MIKSSLATVFTAVSIFICTSSSAQRLSDRNTIGWFGTFNTLYLNKNLSLWLEYQWRRENIITDWQQLFARGGLQCHITNDISVMAGYVFALTYPYGDFPPGPYPVPEHRIFEQLTWNDDAGRIGINHRLRLEQRYQGKVDQAHHDYHVSGWNYMNRIRYQLRGTIPLNNKKMAARTLYTALFDEIFIGFGKTVNQNVFDQNRLGLVLGYQLDKHFRAEGGVINVIQQQGALVQQKNVFQYNTGVIINCYLTLRNQ